MQLEPHQQRVCVEADEMGGRVERLAAFLASEQSAGVEPRERSLMVSQLDAMRTALFYLRARIQLWERKAAEQQ